MNLLKDVSQASSRADCTGPNIYMTVPSNFFQNISHEISFLNPIGLGLQCILGQYKAGQNGILAFYIPFNVLPASFPILYRLKIPENLRFSEGIK